MNNQIPPLFSLAGLLYRFTAPTPTLYKIARNIWAMITAAAGVVLTEAKTGIVLSEHLLLTAKIVGGISALGFLHAQTKVDPAAISTPTNTPTNEPDPTNTTTT